MSTKLLHKQIYTQIQKASNILLVAHIRPDLDTVSSVCAFSCFLGQINKNYTAYCFDRVPFQFNFLPCSQKIYTDQQINFDNFDLIITFDCGSLSRTGLVSQINNRNLSQYIINIDHHIKIDNFADLEIKDKKVCSTTEIIYNFFKINNLKINKDIAECILTGILADSGNFLFSSTSDKNMLIAAEMLENGASWNKVSSKINSNKNTSILKVWGKAISSIKVNKKYNFAFTLLSYDDIKNIDEEVLEGLPEFLSTVTGVKCVISLREKQPNLLRGNIRSHSTQTDVSVLANVLGGGGNKKTAGFVIDGSVERLNQGCRII